MLGLRTVTGSLVITSQKNKNKTLIRGQRGASKKMNCAKTKMVLPLTTQFELYINYKK